MTRQHGFRARAPWLAVLPLAAALVAAGCATGGARGTGAGVPVFVAPDGARATPNTGASRLADGPPKAGTAPAAAAGGATAAAGPAASAEGVTFTWTGGGSSVSVAGDFNNWDQAADPMTKQADGSFTLVKKLAPGRVAYKFVVDGQWKPDPAAKESVDDGFGGTNSVVVVAAGGGATAAPPAAGTAPAANPPTGTGKAPEVTADGVRFTFAGAAKSVHLAGDFNAWAPTADPLTRGADGAWTIVKALPPGSHAYKFVVDGTTWKTDPANPASVDDGFGGKNSIVVVP